MPRSDSIPRRYLPEVERITGRLLELPDVEVLPRLRRLHFRRPAFLQPAAYGRLVNAGLIGDVLLVVAVEPHVPCVGLLLVFLVPAGVFRPRLHRPFRHGQHAGE